MKRLILGFILALGVSFAYAQGNQLCYTSNGSNCIPGIQAAKSVAINTASATTVELVAAETGKTVYVSSWDILAGGTTIVTFKYGTGTNCGTGTVSLTGPYPFAISVAIAKGNGLGSIFNIPQGNALCVTNSQAVQISGAVSYTQF